MWLVHVLLVVLALGFFGAVTARVIGEGSFLAARGIRAGWPVLRVVLGTAVVVAGALLVGWVLTH
jgi:hypothetical protein